METDTSFRNAVNELKKKFKMRSYWVAASFLFPSIFWIKTALKPVERAY
jgi:hypothetical protein